MIWNWPQITYAALTGIGLLCVLALDGEPRTGKHSAAASLIAAGIVWFLLYEGGFLTGAHP